jgi:hypothetical protein
MVTMQRECMISRKQRAVRPRDPPEPKQENSKIWDTKGVLSSSHSAAACCWMGRPHRASAVAFSLAEMTGSGGPGGSARQRREGLEQMSLVIGSACRALYEAEADGQEAGGEGQA